MKKYIQIGGFIPNVGFYEPAAELLKREIECMESITFICSRPDEFTANNERVVHYLSWFKSIGVNFKSSFLLDGRLDIEKIDKSILEPSCFCLMGGDTQKQNDFLKAYKLIEALENFEGLIIGISAGAINMAKIGLVDARVVPHFDSRPKEFVEETLLPLSYEHKIYGLCEDGVILHKNDQLFHFGRVFEIENGELKKINYSGG